MSSRFNVGGTTLYPVAGNILNDQLIYRPEYGGAGLLDDGADFANVRANFAGGVLDGAQYNPVTNRFEAITPSGEFTTELGSAAPITGGTDEGAGDGAFTLADLMSFEAAMRQANFGNMDPETVFSSFEDKGKGTFDIKAAGSDGSGRYLNLFYGTDADGNSVPLNKAVYGPRSSRAGETLDPQQVRNMIRGSLSLIDESGGDGESAGDA
jgi:hypothetical protein